MKTYVYMMEGGRFLKVGISRAPKRRREHIQSGMPIKLKISFIKSFADSERAREVEKETHAALKNAGFHLRGEWFKKNEKSINLAMSLIKGCSQSTDHLKIFKIEPLNDHVSESDVVFLDGPDPIMSSLTLRKITKKAIAFKKRQNERFSHLMEL